MTPATKVPSALLDMLNEAIAREMQAAIQYMWQHVQWSGVKRFAVHDELKSISLSRVPQYLLKREYIASVNQKLGGQCVSAEVSMKPLHS
jgi:hypothetical protein